MVAHRLRRGLDQFIAQYLTAAQDKMKRNRTKSLVIFSALVSPVPDHCLENMNKGHKIASAHSEKAVAAADEEDVTAGWSPREIPEQIRNGIPVPAEVSRKPSGGRDLGHEVGFPANFTRIDLECSHAVIVTGSP
jgi:hypothetical protein